MDDDSSLTSPGADQELAILNRFLAELRGSDRHEQSAVISHYCQLHPELSERIRKIGSGTVRAEALFAEGGPSVTGPQTGDDFNDLPFPPRFGPYRVIRPIGRGGMGEVYEAEEAALHRRVAVKTIRRTRATNPVQLERFDRERQVLAKLHHTHIVPIFATGQEDDLLYFAMPYIRGVALNELILAAGRHSRDNGHSRLTSLENLVEVARSESAETARKKQEGPPIEAEKTDPGPSSPAQTDGGVPTSLPLRYFRAIAAMIADAAEALHHAHEAGVIHRDLKPSNIMIEPSGHPWVLDFGLARLKAGQEPTTTTNGHVGTNDQVPEGDRMADGTSIHQGVRFYTQGPVGTPAYMAPEQHSNGNGSLAPDADGPECDSRIDARTDVWGLGATLYELLTLQRAFHDSNQILHGDPVRPRFHVSNLPRDLEAVCLKALQKDPDDRYQTAQSLADDLRRWLGNQPVLSRKAHTLRRLALWARRNKGWAAAIVITALATVGSLAGTAGYFRMQAKASERELAFQRIQRVTISSHHQNWWNEAWTEVSRAASDRRDARLQTLAFATLIGFDATIERKFRGFDALSLAFDSKGQLLTVGSNDPRSETGRLAARLWDGVSTQQPAELVVTGEGPVGFLRDGAPIQLVLDQTGRTLTLVNLAQQKVLHRFELPGTIDVDSSDDIPAPLGMAPDGSIVAVGVRGPEGKRFVCIWDGRSGKNLHQLEAPASSVAIAPDGSLAATGDEMGHVTVWSLERGQREATLSAGTSKINVLAFGRNPRLGNDDANPLTPRRRWQLAAGDAAATATIWDLAIEQPQVRSICRGAMYEIYSLAFSPDGALLATGARDVALWDPATGQRLLLLPSGSNYTRAIGFSADGRRFAFGLDGPFENPPRLESVVTALDNGHGIQTFHGLVGHHERVVFSPDDRLVAAMTQSWQLGVWDRETASLKLVLDVPPGRFADNVGLAISPDNRHVAFSSHRHAGIWEIETGRLVRSWPLPAGLKDQLVFLDDKHLILARAETRDPNVLPSGGSDPVKYPRRSSIYDLLENGSHEPRRKIEDFNLGISAIGLTPNGRILLLDGWSGTKGSGARAIRAYHIATGARLWEIPSRLPRGRGGFSFDPAGNLVSTPVSELQDRPVAECFLLETSSGKFRDRQWVMNAIGPHAVQWTAGDPDTGRQGLFERDRARPLIEWEPSSLALHRGFTRDGRRIAGMIGDPSAAVVCDWHEVQRRLAAIGLGW
jgi:serine/threonine protein kinase/WD40 repeat protein